MLETLLSVTGLVITTALGTGDGLGLGEGLGDGLGEGDGPGVGDGLGDGLGAGDGLIELSVDGALPSVFPQLNAKKHNIESKIIFSNVLKFSIAVLISVFFVELLMDFVLGL